MTLCKFYQQGNCKFGSSCRFEHPGAGNNRSQPQNRFGALSSGGGGGGNGTFQDALGRYSITTETIEKDLTTEAPQWILSAYAPGRNAPEQLFGGYPREQSFEEMRMHYLAAKASGNEQQALSQAQELYQNAQQQMQTAVSSIQDAARFIVEAENKHPNRIDICREGTQGAPFGEFLVGKQRAQTANPFSTGSASTSPAFGGGAAQPTPSAFGQPSGLGQRPNPFGTPAFGQPAQPSLGFGQPSQPTSAFGQPSAQPQASPFGQPSQPTGTAFGQPAQTTSAFGRPSALGAKPSPFGAPAFGQTAQPAASTGGSAFGQVGQLGAAKPNPFASGGSVVNNTSSPFGVVNNNNAPAPAPAPAANPFASASSAPNNSSANSFGTITSNQNTGASQLNPFGQQQTQNASPFGQVTNQPAKPNPFASGNSTEPQPSSNSFSQNTQNHTNGAFSSNNKPNPFGQAAPPQQNNFGSGTQNQQPAAAPAASQGAASPYPPGSSKQHPSIESYTTNNMNGRLASFKGKPVTYSGNVPGIREFAGTWTRIWFPGGPPSYYKDTELPPEKYDERSKNQWAAFAQTGTFANGVMPELPPPRECTQWDF